jgi:regulator of replication initiation timing
MSKWKQLEFELDELKKSYSNLAQQNKKLIVENHNLKTQIKQKDDLINKLQDDLFIKGGRYYEINNNC